MNSSNVMGYSTMTLWYYSILTLVKEIPSKMISIERIKRKYPEENKAGRKLVILSKPIGIE
jgi:hypothetical protein